MSHLANNKILGMSHIHSLEVCMSHLANNKILGTSHVHKPLCHTIHTMESFREVSQERGEMWQGGEKEQ
jgi:hypothetical protein